MSDNMKSKKVLGGMENADIRNVIKAMGYSDDDLSLANWIFSKIREMNPEHKQPKLDTWAKSIRLMRESDGRSLQQVRELFAWANEHSFWNDKILSPNKLREKWDQLTIQRKKTKDSGAADPFAGAI